MTNLFRTNFTAVARAIYTLDPQSFVDVVESNGVVYYQFKNSPLQQQREQDYFSRNLSGDLLTFQESHRWAVMERKRILQTNQDL